MPRVKRASLRAYADTRRILVAPRAGSRKALLLRLAEALARGGVAARPLDLYADIVNDRFLESGDSKIPVVSLLTTAVNRATVSLAVGARGLLLIAAPVRHADLCARLTEEAVRFLSDPRRTSDLLRATDVEEAWRALA